MVSGEKFGQKWQVLIDFSGGSRNEQVLIESDRGEEI